MARLLFHSANKVTRSQKVSFFQYQEASHCLRVCNLCALRQLGFPLQKAPKIADDEAFSVAISVAFFRRPQAEAPCIPCFALPPGGIIRVKNVIGQK
jgi:hypothetical protein